MHYGRSRYVNVINEDGTSVTTKVVIKQLYYMSSFIITVLLHLIYFIVVFICRALRLPDTDRRPCLRLSTMRASSRWPVWLEDGAAQLEAPEETEVRAIQQEAPEEPDVEDAADDPPQLTYRLVQF
jgi:hypothetical protein